MNKIKKNDQVLIISGKDRGKTGKVEKVIGKEDKVIVSGINMRKKHLRPTRKQPKGGIVDQAGPIDISNIKLICQKCQKPSRVGIKITKDGKKRFCKKCQELI
jgi:large subunit ribosomal protein L24